MGGKWVGFYCDSSVDSFYYDIVICTVVCNTVSFKHVHFDYEQYIFTVCALLLPYVLHYYHMCFIITICAILLPYVLYYYHMCILNFGGLARSYIVNVCAWIDTFRAVLH